MMFDLGYDGDFHHHVLFVNVYGSDPLSLPLMIVSGWCEGVGNVGFATRARFLGMGSPFWQS